MRISDWSSEVGSSDLTAHWEPGPWRRSSSPATSSPGIPEPRWNLLAGDAGSCQRIIPRRVDSLRHPLPRPERMNTPRSKRTSSRPTRRLLVAVVVIALAVLAAWYWKSRTATADEGAWRTTTVERGNIRVAISATGTLSAISTVTVGSQVSGQVTDVLVDFNDKVVRDQVIARIDPSTFEAQINQGNAQVASARASLKQAQAALANAEADYRRTAEPGAQQLVAKSDADLARRLARTGRR